MHVAEDKDVGQNISLAICQEMEAWVELAVRNHHQIPHRRVEQPMGRAIGFVFGERNLPVVPKPHVEGKGQDEADQMHEREHDEGEDEGCVVVEVDQTRRQAFIDRPPAHRMRRLRPIDFARFRWVTRLREGHRLQMEVLHGGWWGWVYRAV